MDCPFGQSEPLPELHRIDTCPRTMPSAICQYFIGACPPLHRNEERDARSNKHRAHPRRMFSLQSRHEGKLVICRKEEPWCGFAKQNFSYEHEPRTKYQAWCRKRATEDIQHYTRTYPPKKVERWGRGRVLSLIDEIFVESSRFL